MCQVRILIPAALQMVQVAGSLQRFLHSQQLSVIYLHRDILLHTRQKLLDSWCTTRDLLG